MNTFPDAIQREEIKSELVKDIIAEPYSMHVAEEPSFSSTHDSLGANERKIMNRIESLPDISNSKTVDLKGSYRLLQLFEGKVLEVGENDFEAVITDKTTPHMPDEIVLMDIEEVSPDDRKLLVPGAVFYWSIGYADIPGKGRVRESKIRFRRLVGFSKTQIKKAMEDAKKLADFFKPATETTRD